MTACRREPMFVIALLRMVNQAIQADGAALRRNRQGVAAEQTSLGLSFNLTPTWRPVLSDGSRPRTSPGPKRQSSSLLYSVED